MHAKELDDSIQNGLGGFRRGLPEQLRGIENLIHAYRLFRFDASIGIERPDDDRRKMLPAG